MEKKESENFIPPSKKKPTLKQQNEIKEKILFSKPQLSSNTDFLIFRKVLLAHETTYI